MGHPKPDNLDISWNPLDRKAAARKTRKFVLESVLIHVSEAINQYFSALSKLPRFESLRQSWDAPKADTSVAGKLTDIATDLLGSDEYHIAAAALLRDQQVHSLKVDRKKIAYGLDLANTILNWIAGAA